MRGQVRYLARLARQASGGPTLQPPRQVFAGDAYAPARPSRQASLSLRPAADSAAPAPPAFLAPGGASEVQPTPEPEAFPHGHDGGPDPVAGMPGSPFIPAGPAPALGPPTPAGTPAPVPPTPPGPLTRPALAAGSPTSPVASPAQAPAGSIAPSGGPEPAWPTPVAPHSRRAARIGPAGTTDDDPAARASAPPAALSVKLPESDRTRLATTGPSRPTVSWTSPLWGEPVDLPGSAGLRPVDDGTKPPAATAPPEDRAAVPPGPAPESPASPYRKPSLAGTGLPVTLTRGHAAPPPSREAASDLVPPPMPQPALRPTPGAEPEEWPRGPGGSGPPRVSIGTVEVTVVPPAPAPAAREIQPPAQAARGWSRPPARFAASDGGGRLRDGVRRWYGTAQS
jgi:hypothetical protein